MPPKRLTDTGVKNAKPGEKTKRLFDGRGLYLEISPAGGKWWRLKYRIDGKEKRISLGVYPDVRLKAAREARDQARELIAQGIDPSAQRQAEKAARQESNGNSFEVIAREWHAQQAPGWSKKHAETVLSRLEGNVFPWLGKLPITDIRAPKLLEAVRRVESRGAVETAHRVLNICGQVFRYAIATGRAERDVAINLKGALQPVKPKHLAAVVDPKRVGELLREIDAYEGTLPVHCALRLAPLVFVRPGELRTARWADIDFDNAQWCYEVSKTKTPHIVPLATQAVEILKELHPLTGNREYVFPSALLAIRQLYVCVSK